MLSSLASVVILVLAGCGARSGVEVREPVDGGMDATAPGPPDARPFDAGRPAEDGGVVDAQPPLPPVFPPTKPPPPIRPTISAGTELTCATLDDGTVACWGANGWQQIGFMTASDPVPLATRVPGVADVVSVALSPGHSCALHVDGSASCWGANLDSALGRAGLPTSTEPLPPGPVDNLPHSVALSSGCATCAVTDDGELYCWGGNFCSRPGGRPGVVRTPERLEGVSGVTHHEMGESHGCALSGPSVTCWGDPRPGLFGTSSRMRPQEPTVVAELEGAVQLAGGDSINCALLSDGTVTCCPYTDGSTVSYMCVPVPYLSGVVHIAAAGAYGCAILLDGTVWCWGRDNHAMFGPEVDSFYPSPVPINGVRDAVELAAGQAHVCARRSDRSILCWGKNDVGQLGIGMIDDAVHGPEIVALPR